jgi:type II secretory pathway pseudopilin PulG
MTGLVVVIVILGGAACGIVLFASTRSRARRRAAFDNALLQNAFDGHTHQR